MFKWLGLFVLVVIWRDVYGDIQDEMTEVIQKCCNDGSVMARRRASQDCSAPEPVPPDVPQSFGSLCIMARAQCCKDYFHKKKDCDLGIDFASRNNQCNSTKESIKGCCDECARGISIGHARGRTACVARTHTEAAEELLSDDAYVKCCLKAASEGPVSISHPATAKKEKREGLASICEDYAPTELCAHHCIPVPGSYRCECNPGFMLMADGKNCKEVVKNRCKPRNPCQHKCNDNGVDVMCSCRRGYELMPDGKSCQDIDECQLDIPVCLTGTQCHNIQGSYRCLPAKTPNPRSERGQCPPGFAKNINNNACDDINECKLPNPPCPTYVCENTVGGYKCGGVSGDPANLSTSPRPPVEDRCPPGFVLGSRGECADMDECAASKDDCNSLSQFCINTHGSFYCQDKVSKLCRPGFKINTSTNKCEDINECEEEEDLCRPDQICINQLGQYDCKPKTHMTRSKSQECPEGMRINQATLQCQDIDECVEGTHLCDQHQNCLNTNGSFVCHCKLGYELDTFTGACVDVNECATGQHDCLSGSQRCDNTVGSFLCIRIASCGTGYILQYSTGKCEDVDECALGIHNCARAGPMFQCMNIPGSFRCVRKRQPTTTTTTAAPEYEYEYYDSEEETDGNQTALDNKPSSPTPVIIHFQEPSQPTTASTAVPPTIPKEIPRIEDNIVIPDSRVDERQDPSQKPDIPEPTPPVEPYQPEQPKNQPGPRYEPYEPRYEPSEPRHEPEQPEEKPTETPREDPRRPDPRREPEVRYPEPKSESPTQPEIVYKEPSESGNRDTPASTYYETRNEPENPISNEIIPQVTEQSVETEKSTEQEPKIVLETEPTIIRIEPSPSPVPTYNPYAPNVKPELTPSPHGVYVKVGNEETATVPERREDDSKNIPDNKWPPANVKPIPCPFGLEMNDYGGCFDIDECATNRHSCSGLTEVCRNTHGGYLCDCAPGFRRDSVTGACDVYTVSSTTPLPPIFHPDLLHPIIPSYRTEPTPPTTASTEPPTTPRTTPVPVSSTEKATTPRSRSFWGYEDESFLTSRPFRPSFWCDAGYRRNPKTGRCEDINECTNGHANCASDEVCVNTVGGFKCECRPGWEVDQVRHRCVPVMNNGKFPTGYGNEPDYQPSEVEQKPFTPVDPNPEITQIEDRGAVLKCPWGYRLGDDHTCVDVDECVTGEAKCGPVQICTNLQGGYSCSCPLGQRLKGDHECEDIDECDKARNMSICSHNADCVNTIGSYQCKCHSGFRSAPFNDKVCVDVDECSESRTGSLCQHRCNNVWGSHRCSCHRGYRLNSDNRTCSDVDECVQFKSKVPCVGRCLNEPGSYRCACPRGYRLAEDKRSCIDIDECETGEATCQSGVLGDTSHVCFNTRGSFRCTRITCPPGYKLESKHRCTKTQRVCGAGDWKCAHQPTTISYNFITFVSNLFVPESNVKLFTMRGPTWPYAKMKFELRLLDVNAPPSVKDRADINSFLLIQNDNEAVMSLVRPLEGPQSIELELSMELYSREQFGGIAIAKLFIFVSEYEF